MTEALRAVSATLSTRSGWVLIPSAGPPWRVTRPLNERRLRWVSPASMTILTRTPVAPDENGHPVQHRVRRADMNRAQFAALWAKLRSGCNVHEVEWEPAKAT